MQDAAVTVYLVVLFIRVQQLADRHIDSRLTSPLGNQHNPLFLGYFVLESPKRLGYARRPIFIRLDTFSFPPPDA